MKALVTLLLTVAINLSIAQTKAAPYSLIDRRVKTIQSSNPDFLAGKLTQPYKKEIEKVRAIFRWITENIEYDTEGYHNTDIYKGLWNPMKSYDQEFVDKDYNNRIIQKVLKEKKAICDGYSRLFKSLCDYAGIRCEIVSGYIRWSSDPMGAEMKRGHAWNAVLINNSWRLIDATWASGYCNEAVTSFTKSFNDFFFLTDPVEFFNDHFPADKNWSLLPITPDLHEFYNFPFYHPDFYRNKIISLNPTTGSIQISKYNKSVIIEIGTTKSVKNMKVYEFPYIVDTLFLSGDNTNPGYRIVGNKIIYTYKVQSDRSEKLKVYLNDMLILTYGIKLVR